MIDARRYLRFAHFCGIGRDKNLPGRLLCGRASLIAGSALANAARSTMASGTNIIYHRIIERILLRIIKQDESLNFAIWDNLHNFYRDGNNEFSLC